MNDVFLPDFVQERVLSNHEFALVVSNPENRRELRELQEDLTETGNFGFDEKGHIVSTFNSHFNAVKKIIETAWLCNMSVLRDGFDEQAAFRFGAYMTAQNMLNAFYSHVIYQLKNETAETVEKIFVEHCEPPF